MSSPIVEILSGAAAHVLHVARGPQRPYSETSADPFGVTRRVVCAVSPFPPPVVLPQWGPEPWISVPMYDSCMTWMSLGYPNPWTVPTPDRL